MHHYRISNLTIRSDIELPGMTPVAEGGPVQADVRWARLEADDLLDRSTGVAWRADPEALVLAVRGVGVYRVRGGSRIEVDPARGAHHKDLVLFLLGSAMGALWHQRGVLPLHAGAVLVDPRGGGCVAFAGPSGIGKSTLVAFLNRRGHQLVADDVSVIDARNGEMAVWRGPRRLKLWRDGLSELGEDPASLPRAGGRREKYNLEVEDEVVEADPVPLRALYELAEGDEAGVQRVKGLEAVELVSRHTYRRDFIGPMGLETRHFRLCAAFAGAVAIRRLVRPRGFEHMDAVLDVLQADWSDRGPA